MTDLQRRTVPFLAGVGRRLAGPVMVMSGVVLAFGVLIFLLNPVTAWVTDDSILELGAVERAASVDATRHTLLQGAVGVLTFAALVFTGRTYLLNRAGQVTDRFTKAVDQLAGNVAQRTGGASHWNASCGTRVKITGLLSES